MMAAFNAQSTIRRSISSTLFAMPKDSQLTVWDDGSSDRTAEIADRFDDARLTVIRSESNDGSGAARCAILDRTDSKLVACVDADDICLPWRFKAQWPMLRQADFCFGAAVRFSTPKWGLRLTMQLSLSPELTPLVLLMHNPLSHSSFLGVREVLEDVGGYSELRIGQDYELWLRAAGMGVRIAKTGFPVLLYRQSAQQVSGSPHYVKRILANDDVRRAYAALVRQEIPEALGVNRDLSHLAINGDSALRVHLHEQVRARMSGIMKLYYMRVCEQGRAVIPF